MTSLLCAGYYGQLIADELAEGRAVIVGIDRAVRGVILPAHCERFCRIALDPDEVWDVRAGGCRSETKFNRKPYLIQVPWDAVTHVETEERVMIDPSALYLLCEEDAREILGDDEPSLDRAEYEIKDSLRRALRNPERFDGTWLRSRTEPSFAEILDARPKPVLDFDWDADESEELAQSVRTEIRPGDVFRFTGSALQSMYGYRKSKRSGSPTAASPDERWTAAECSCGLCASGRFVASESGRHFARAGVERCLRYRGMPQSSDDAALFEAERDQLGVERGRGMVVPRVR